MSVTPPACRDGHDRTDGSCDVTVLLADDDATALAFMADNLTADRYRVRTASSRAKALAILSVEQPDVVVVDVNGTTLDLIDAVRSGQGVAASVDPDTLLLVLTSRVDELHRIRLLDRGGDDVVVKPFSYPELRARIAALLRRARARRSPHMLRVGELRIDLDARIASIGGTPLELRAKEYDLLCVLAGDPSRVFTREELLRAVWGGPYARSRTLDSHACRLRQRLQNAGGEGLLRSVWGIGYRLTDGELR